MPRHESSVYTEIRIDEDRNTVDTLKANESVSMPTQQKSPATSGDGNTTEKKNTPRSSLPVKKRPKFVDQAPKHRTAMGEYVKPEGGEPLTQNERFRPIGPADYMHPRLNLYKSQAPEWSILNRHPTVIKVWCPAPNAYLLPDGIVKKNRFTFGKRLKPNKRATAGACRHGPTYSVKGHETGRNAPKYSVPRAQRGGMGTGPPSSLITPVDCPGFSTPGPRPYSIDGVLPHPRHAEITSRPKYRDAAEDLPGPSDYHLSSLEPGLQKSFGIARKPELHAKETPGPNLYDLGTKMGEGPKYTMRLPCHHGYTDPGPSACTYMKEREYSHKQKITMGCRFIPPRTAKSPAPNSYDPKIDPMPGFTFKDRVKVPFPSSIHSCYADGPEKSPGPAAHYVQLPDNFDRGATFKRRHTKSDTGPMPGPSDYGRPDCGQLSTKPCAPAFSMRPVWRASSAGGIPGPAAYPTVALDPGLATTMKSRHRTTTRQTLPAPNAYIPKKQCTRWGPVTGGGITMKSRHSPWVYSGLKNNLKLESKDCA